jgi:hypothetical protein
MSVRCHGPAALMLGIFTGCDRALAMASHAS